MHDERLAGMRFRQLREGAAAIGLEVERIGVAGDERESEDEREQAHDANSD